MDTPIGSACDLISIMLRRDSDFGPVAAAFKSAPLPLPCKGSGLGLHHREDRQQHDDAHHGLDASHRNGCAALDTLPLCREPALALQALLKCSPVTHGYGWRGAGRLSVRTASGDGLCADGWRLHCRDLAADERLQKDYWPLYTLMRRAAAAPLLAFPEKDEEAALEVHMLCLS